MKTYYHSKQLVWFLVLLSAVMYLAYEKDEHKLQKIFREVHPGTYRILIPGHFKIKFTFLENFANII